MSPVIHLDECVLLYYILTIIVEAYVYNMTRNEGSTWVRSDQLSKPENEL